MSDPKIISAEEARGLDYDAVDAMSDGKRIDAIHRLAHTVLTLTAERDEARRERDAATAELTALRTPKPNTATWSTRTVGPYKGWTELRRASGRLVGRYIRRTPESERVEVMANGMWFTAPGEESARQSILNRLPKGVEVVGG